jgi:hypothetical protein
VVIVADGNDTHGKVFSLSFSEEEKIKNFDRLAEVFYKHNFGTVSKTDLELLMFDFAMNNILANTDKNNGVLDNTCSAYCISKLLGITQQKVDNLKVKRQLKYPMNYDWQASLAKLTKNALYDFSSNKLIIAIPDPNLFIEIQNFIEENGGYIDLQMNKKLMHIRPEYFLELAYLAETDENKGKIEKAIRTQITKQKKDSQKFEPSHMGKSLLDLTVNTISLISGISALSSTIPLIGSLVKLFPT